MMWGLPAWAVRGAKVVCVRADLTLDGKTVPFEEGREYTLGEAWFADDLGKSYCSIEGAESSGWRLDRFRPAVPRRTEAEDLAEHFTPILDRHSPATVVGRVDA